MAIIPQRSTNCTRRKAYLLASNQQSPPAAEITTGAGALFVVRLAIEETPKAALSGAIQLLGQIQNTLGCVDAGFAAIDAIALKAAISGSILAVPEACLVTRIALPFGSSRALVTGIVAVATGRVILAV